jgi:hypothetical protein
LAGRGSRSQQSARHGRFGDERKSASLIEKFEGRIKVRLIFALETILCRNIEV